MKKSIKKAGILAISLLMLLSASIISFSAYAEEAPPTTSTSSEDISISGAESLSSTESEQIISENNESGSSVTSEPIAEGEDNTAPQQAPLMAPYSGSDFITYDGQSADNAAVTTTLANALTSKILTINATFPENAVERKLVIELKEGIKLVSAPGFKVTSNAVSGGFNPALLTSDAQREIVKTASWARTTTKIYSYLPFHGTLIYEFNETTSATLDLLVTIDQAFYSGGTSGGSIRTTTMANIKTTYKADASSPEQISQNKPFVLTVNGVYIVYTYFGTGYVSTGDSYTFSIGAVGGGGGGYSMNNNLIREATLYFKIPAGLTATNASLLTSANPEAGLTWTTVAIDGTNYLAITITNANKLLFNFTVQVDNNPALYGTSLTMNLSGGLTKVSPWYSDYNDETGGHWSGSYTLHVEDPTKPDAYKIHGYSTSKFIKDLDETYYTAFPGLYYDASAYRTITEKAVKLTFPTEYIHPRLLTVTTTGHANTSSDLYLVVKDVEDTTDGPDGTNKVIRKSGAFTTVDLLTSFPTETWLSNDDYIVEAYYFLSDAAITTSWNRVDIQGRFAKTEVGKTISPIIMSQAVITDSSDPSNNDFNPPAGSPLQPGRSTFTFLGSAQITTNPSSETYYVRETGTTSNISQILSGKSITTTISGSATNEYGSYKGLSLYVRTLPYATIDPDSLIMKDEKGNVHTAQNITTHTDTDGNLVYRLDYPDLVMGVFDEVSRTSGSFLFSFTQAIDRAAPTKTYDFRNYLVWVPMGQDALGGAAPSFSASMPKDTTGIIDPNSLGQQYVTLSTARNFTILAGKELYLGASNSVDEGTTWHTYDSGAGTGTVVVSPGQDSYLYQLEIANPIEKPATALIAYIPIPKQGETFTTAAASYLFNWSSILEVEPENDASSGISYTYQYSTSYTPTNSDWKAWSDITDKSTIRLVKAEAVSFSANTTDKITLSLSIPEENSYLPGKNNTYPSYVYYDLEGVGNAYVNTQLVSVSLPLSKVSGVAYYDTDADNTLDVAETGRFKDIKVYLFEAGTTTPVGNSSGYSTDADGKFNIDVSYGGKIDISIEIPATLEPGGLRFSSAIGTATPGVQTIKIENYQPLPLNETVEEIGIIRPFTVTYDSKLGSSVADEKVWVNEKATEPADPSRTGWTFDGWYKESTYSNKWDFATDTVTQDITLYAKWEGALTVTFDSQGGTPTPSSITKVEPGSIITAPSNPSRTGWTFVGWYKEAAGTTPWVFATDTVTQDITLYAKWEGALTVTFDSQGGTPTPSSITKVAPGSIITAPSNPSRTGWTFVGWYKEAAGTTPWNFATDTVNQDITLYAKWVEATYKIVFHSNNGDSATVEQGFDYNQTQALRANTFAYSGYIFKGWATTNGSSTVAFADNASYQFTAVTDVDLYAVWEKIANPTITVPAGTKVDVNTNITKVLDIKYSELNKTTYEAFVKTKVTLTPGSNAPTGTAVTLKSDYADVLAASGGTFAPNGTYAINVWAEDEFGNKSAATAVPLNVIDDTNPVVFTGTSTFSIRQGTSITDSDILTSAGIFFTDDYADGSTLAANSTTTWDRPFNSSVTGVYTATIKTTDTVGNISAEKTVTVTVWQETVSASDITIGSRDVAGMTQATYIAQSGATGLYDEGSGTSQTAVVKMDYSAVTKYPGTYVVSYETAIGTKGTFTVTVIASKYNVTVKYHDGVHPDEHYALFPGEDVPATVPNPLWDNHDFLGWVVTEGETKGIGWTFGIDKTPYSDITIEAYWQGSKPVSSSSTSSSHSRPSTSGSSSTISGGSSSATGAPSAGGSTTQGSSSTAVSQNSQISSGTTSISDGENVLAEPENWALLNLIVMVIGLFTSLVLIVTLLIGKRNKEDNYASDASDKNERTSKSGIVWRLLAILISIVSLIVFLFTENMNSIMVFVDKWTVLMVVFALIEAIFVILMVNSRKEKSTTEEY